MKDILFTIDDGPSSDTQHLVDFLKAREIPVIMFFIGQNMEKYADQVDYVIQSGVLIGNHTYSHPAMSSLSLEGCIDEIEKTEKIIDAAYQRNAKERPHKVFRFPFLDTGELNRPGIMKYLLEHGFKNVQSAFVTYKWFDVYRAEPHIAGTFHCWDWELWNNPERFGIAELFEKLHVEDDPDLGNLFGGDSGEIFLIHDAGWKTNKDERHYELIVEELQKTSIRYVAPVF